MAGAAGARLVSGFKPSPPAPPVNAHETEQGQADLRLLSQRQPVRPVIHRDGTFRWPAPDGDAHAGEVELWRVEKLWDEDHVTVRRVPGATLYSTRFAGYEIVRLSWHSELGQPTIVSTLPYRTLRELKAAVGAGKILS